MFITCPVCGKPDAIYDEEKETVTCYSETCYGKRPHFLKKDVLKNEQIIEQERAIAVCAPLLYIKMKRGVLNERN